jgi:pimeloyl-ACP methyl ester carboxylesterase
MLASPRTRWLLLRGLAREARHWGTFPQALAAVLDAEVTSLDLPGFGTEHARRSPASVKGIVRDVRERFTALRKGEPCCVMAISLGGMVALEWCSQFPTDFERCVTINTSSRLSAPRERFRTGARAVLTVAGAPVSRERAVLRMSSNLPEVDREAIARRYAGWLAERPPSLSSVARQLLAASLFRAPKGLSVPLLVLGSSADRLVSWRCSRAIAAAFAAPLRLHDRAGHDLPLDDPEWICKEVALWVTPPGRASRRTG